MKNLHIILLLLFTNTIVCAQNRSNWAQYRGGTSSFQQPNMTVKGRLIDLETSDDLSFATISIETVDSILISGGITDENGKFKIEISPMQMMKKIRENRNMTPIDFQIQSLVLDFKSKTFVIEFVLL